MKATWCKLLVAGLLGLLVSNFSHSLGMNKAAAEPASTFRRTSIVPAEAFQGRLRLTGSTSVALERYGGDVVEVNAEDVSLGATGINLQPSDFLIDSSGTSTGASMFSSTTYNAYVSNSSASSFPSDLRASTTAPTLLNGIKYLGTSGNAANWRFVGWVRTDGFGQFRDAERERYVINYYNRRPLTLRVVETTNGWTYNGGTWRAWNDTTANSVVFISNGEDLVHLTFTCVAANSGGQACFVSAGIGLDSTSAPATSSTYSGTATWNWVHVTLTATFSGVTSEGLHSLYLLEISENVGTTNWQGDAGKTFILPGATGYVMG